MILSADGHARLFQVEPAPPLGTHPLANFNEARTSLEPGAGIPPHVHEDLEQTYVLEGSLVDQEGECTAGNFVIRAKGSRHSPVAPNGCTMVVFFMKPTAGLRKALLGRG